MTSKSIMAVVVGGAMLLTGQRAQAASYSQTFDTDAADGATTAASYSDWTLTQSLSGAVDVTGGVLNFRGGTGMDAAGNQTRLLISANNAIGSATFGNSYTIQGDLGISDSSPLWASPTLMVSSNLGIEFGMSNPTHQEYFRVIAHDFPANTSSLGGIPVQVPDIGFNIANGVLYTVTAEVNRLIDDSVTLDVTIKDTNSASVYTMTTLHVSAADVPLLFGTFDSAGFKIRGTPKAGLNGGALFDNFAINPVPEPASLALVGLGGLLVLRRCRSH